MLTIRRGLMLPIMLVSIIFALGAQDGNQSGPVISISELREYLELDLSLGDIYGLLNNGEEVPSDRYYLLTGTVTAVTTIDDSPDSFYSEVDFLSARWIDDDALESYSAVLVFEDASFAERLPVRIPRDPPADLIRPNSRGLVIASFDSLFQYPDGTVQPVFVVHYFQNID